jgi:membrane associated rhomboid family serine protease
MLENIGPAAMVILALNIGLGIAGLWVNPKIVERCVFRPYEFARGHRRGTLIASGFAHADVPHLLFNMVTFFFFGVPMEHQLGTGRFLVLYALGLALSPVISLIRHRDNPAYATLGASGAVSAVLFAFITYFPEAPIAFIFLPIPMPAWVFAAGYLAYSIWASHQNKGRINHDAHLAGAITGIAFVAVTDPRAVSALLRQFGM